MKKKLLVIGLMLVLMLTVLAACGAPGYVANPPKDIDDYVEKLEDNDWDVDEWYGRISAFKAEFDQEDLYDEDKIDDDEYIAFESLSAMYWAEGLDTLKDFFDLDNDEMEDLINAMADAVNDIFPDIQDEIVKAFKDNDCKITVTMKANDYAYVTYMKTSGKAGDIRAAMEDAQDAMNDMQDDLEDVLQDVMRDLGLNLSPPSATEPF